MKGEKESRLRSVKDEFQGREKNEEMSVLKREALRRNAPRHRDTNNRQRKKAPNA